MNTVVVWVLVMTLSGYKAGGPLVIDNISSRENCEAVASQIRQTYTYGRTINERGDTVSFSADTHRCIAVRKVK